jgi:hypothetical protein
VLPVGSLVCEPEKLSVEDDRASVHHRVASQSRDGASVDAAADGFVLLLVAKLEFNRGAGPQSVGALHECAPCRHVDYRYIVARSDSRRNDPMLPWVPTPMAAPPFSRRIRRHG